MKKFHLSVEDAISLEAVSENDAQDLFNLIVDNRSYLSKWLPWVDGVRNLEDIKNGIKAAQSMEEQNGMIQSIVRFKGELVGAIGMETLDEVSKVTALGGWIGEKFQGQGIMSKAFFVIVHFIFETRNINRIEMRCASCNKRSRKIPERLGFIEEGTLKEAEFLNGKYNDVVIYRLLRSELSRLSKPVD